MNLAYLTATSTPNGSYITIFNVKLTLTLADEQ